MKSKELNFSYTNIEPKIYYLYIRKQEIMDLERLYEKILVLKERHHLTDVNFDTECIYELGNLSGLLKSIIDKTIPEAAINISEIHNKEEKKFIATLSNQFHKLEISADDYADWLPDDFFMNLENIPVIFETGKQFYSINPAIGLTGQDAWYFCGTETQLKAARTEGIPLVFPCEDVTEAKEYKELYGD